MSGGVVMTGGVSALVGDYVAMRRGLGYRSAVQERACGPSRDTWTG
jgi:hypothetical protein